MSPRRAASQWVQEIRRRPANRFPRCPGVALARSSTVPGMTKGHSTVNKSKVLWSALAVVAGSVLALPSPPAQAQTKTQPERSLLGVNLGRPYTEVLRKFG